MLRQLCERSVSDTDGGSNGDLYIRGLGRRMLGDEPDVQCLDELGDECYREFLADLLEDGDELTVVDWAPSGAPKLSNERLAALVGLTGTSARGKAGWTDVATFQELGVPATNFGAGDPLLAHRSDEKVTLEELEIFERVLREWLT